MIFAVLVLLAPVTAVAASGSPRGGSDGWYERYSLPAGSQPWSIAVTGDGTVWTTLTGRRQLAALDPATGRWQFIDLPEGLAHPARLAAGPDGSLWLTDNDFGKNPSHRLWRYRPAGEGPAEARDATGDQAAAVTGGGAPRGRWQAFDLPFAGASAVVATDDAVWILQFQGNHLGRLDPETGRVVPFNLPLPGYPWPSGWDLDMDRAGRLWTVSPRSGTVYRFDPAEGEWASFPLPPDVAGPAALAVTPAGDGVWVSEHGGRTIGRLDVATRAWVPFQTPPAPPAEEIEATRPNDLEWDEQGFLWVALHTGNALARIDPSSGTLELFPFPAAEPKTWVQWLARAPDGSLWFAAYGRDYVGRVDPATLPLLQLSATVETPRLAPGGSTQVRLVLVSPEPDTVTGAVEWEVPELPRDWRVQWEERGPDGARARLVVPRDAEVGIYPLVMAAQVEGRGSVTRTVRVQVATVSALPWATLAAFGALVGALVVGWMGVLAGVQTERVRFGGHRS